MPVSDRIGFQVLVSSIVFQACIESMRDCSQQTLTPNVNQLVLPKVNQNTQGRM